VSCRLLCLLHLAASCVCQRIGELVSPQSVDMELQERRRPDCLYVCCSLPLRVCPNARVGGTGSRASLPGPESVATATRRGALRGDERGETEQAKRRAFFGPLSNARTSVQKPSNTIVLPAPLSLAGPRSRESSGARLCFALLLCFGFCFCCALLCLASAVLRPPPRPCSSAFRNSDPSYRYGRTQRTAMRTRYTARRGKE